MKKIFELMGTVVVAFAIAMFLNTAVFAMPEVRMNSMAETFIQGERVLELKFIYNLTSPSRGDVIVLDKDNESKGFFLDYFGDIKEIMDIIRGKGARSHLIKRVIAIPGDEIKINGGQVHINGQLLKETYTKGETYADGLEFPLTVPQGKVFVMGDNREVSLDSRQLGFIDYKQIEGKAVAKIWPVNKLKIIKNER